jgi:hypothetical protein
MQEIPMKAKVECADGPCGEFDAIIVHPVTQEVTHLVVSVQYSEPRLVPIDQVAGTSHDLIRLRCTQDELGSMEPFLKVHYVDQVGGDYGPPFGADPYAFEATFASYEVSTVPVEEERIPPGELAFHPGADVEATDGHIGKVGEFLTDPTSGHITHLVLLEGHLWGKKEVTLPVSAIARVATDTVYLNLDKAAVEALPAVPAKRR